MSDRFRNLRVIASADAPTDPEERDDLELVLCLQCKALEVRTPASVGVPIAGVHIHLCEQHRVELATRLMAAEVEGGASPELLAYLVIHRKSSAEDLLGTRNVLIATLEAFRDEQTPLTDRLVIELEAINRTIEGRRMESVE